MPHASHIWRPKNEGQVTLCFYVPSDMVTPHADDVFVSTGAQGVICVPRTLMRESDEPDFVAFEAQVPTDIAAAVRSMCEVMFGQTFIEE